MLRLIVNFVDPSYPWLLETTQHGTLCLFERTAQQAFLVFLYALLQAEQFSTLKFTSHLTKASSILNTA
jgi:hypothetical protein